MPTSAGKQLKGGSSGVSTTKGVRRTHLRPLLPISVHTEGCYEIMKMIEVLYSHSVKASAEFYAQETMQFVLRNGWR